ncbi:transport protein [Ceratobasidium sp. AG-Ba]|nr:transport protein [Ceratobasidium sp. AG-Ba]
MFGLETSKGKIIEYLILEGIGIGSLVAAQASAPSPERAVITGSRNFFCSLGGTIGLVATKNTVLKKELLAISGLSSQAAASIIKLGPQALADASMDGAVRGAYMRSIRAVFTLFIPIAGLSAIVSLFMKSVYLQGDKDVLPVAKPPTPPSSQDNLELRAMVEEGDTKDSTDIAGKLAKNLPSNNAYTRTTLAHT